MSPAAAAGVSTTRVPRDAFTEDLRKAILTVSDLSLEEFIQCGRQGQLEGELHDLWLMVSPLFR